MFVGSIEPNQGCPRPRDKTFFEGRAVPDLASLYDHHAEDCLRSAEKIDNPEHRAMLLKAAAEWRVAAEIQREPLAAHGRLSQGLFYLAHSIVLLSLGSDLL